MFIESSSITQGAVLPSVITVSPILSKPSKTVSPTSYSSLSVYACPRGVGGVAVASNPSGVWVTMTSEPSISSDISDPANVSSTNIIESAIASTRNA